MFGELLPSLNVLPSSVLCRRVLGKSSDTAAAGSLLPLSLRC